MYKKLLIFTVIGIVFFAAITGCTESTIQGLQQNNETADDIKNEDNDSFTLKVDEIFTKAFEREKFNGYVLITKNDKISFEKAYGMADNKNQIPITNESLFDIASLTKQFTAVSIMMLQEKGLLNVEDTIDRYISDFPHGDKITIHHLLTHTSGIPNNPMEFDLKKFRPNSIKAESKPSDIKLHFEPGKNFEYCSPGYVLLGYIIEGISGKELGSFFKENIFEPLGMNNTRFKDESYNAPNLAVGYDNFGVDKAQPSIYDIDFTVRGGGGLCSSAKDLLKWNNALYTDELLSQDSIDTIFTPNKANYGYGYFIENNSDGTKTYEHYGTAAGYRSYIMRKPSNKTCVIILSNYQDCIIESIVRAIKNIIE